MTSTDQPLIIQARVALQGLLRLAAAEGAVEAYGLKLAVEVVEAIIEGAGKRTAGGVAS